MTTSSNPLRVGAALTAAFLAAALPLSHASLPSTTTSNLTVVYANGGAVSTGTNGSTTLTVTSTAPVTVLNWGNFWDGTAAGGTSVNTDIVNFTLPGATSSILNQIAGNNTANPTTINGSITSNGKVSLINANGIVLSNTGIVNVAGLFLSTFQENASYFEQNGILQEFTATPPPAPGTTPTNVNVQNGASITTVGGGGDIRIAGNNITLGTGNALTGNVYLVGTNATGAGTISVAGNGSQTVAQTIAGGVTSGGNLTISSNGSAVNLSSGGSLSVQGNLVVTTSGGNLNVAGTAPDTVTGSSTLNTSLNTTLNPSGTTAGTVTNSGPRFTSGGVSIVTGSGTSTSSGTVNISDLSISGSGNTLALTSGTTTVTDTQDAALTLSNSTVGGALTLSNTLGGGGSIVTQNYGSTAVTPAAVTVTTALASLSATKNISFNGSGSENFLSISAGGGSAAITTTGNITLTPAGNITVATLSLTSTGGTITQTTTGANALTSGTLLTVNAPTIALNNTSNSITNVVLKGGATGGVSLADAVGLLTIANGTATTGNTSVTMTGGTNIQFGTTVLGVPVNSDSVSIGGNLTLSGGNIITNAGTVTVTGNTAITATGSINLGLNTASPVQAYNFTGPISSTSGAGGLSIWANSGVALGTTTTAGNLSVITALTGTGNSGISNASGTITVAGTTTLQAGTKASASNIQLGTTAQPAQLNGTVTTNTGNNLTLVNSVPTTIGGGTNAINGLTSITQTGNAGNNAVTINAALANLSVMDTGVNLTGNTTVTIANGATAQSLGLSNWSVGGTGTATVVVSNGAITLGAGINDTNTGLTIMTSNGTGAGISDTAASPVYVFGPINFNSDGPINLSNNTLSSMGAVGLTLTTNVATQNNNNITYTEGSSANIATVAVPLGLGGTYSGTVAITSVSGNVIESDSSSIIVPASGRLTLTANSATGQVLLNSTNAAVNQIAAPVSITATGNSVIWSNQNLQLAGVSVWSGTFTATTGTSAGLGASGKTITEATGTTIYTYNNDSFNTNGGAVTLSQSGNNFGAISVSTKASAGAAGTNAAGGSGLAGGAGGNSNGGAVTIKEFGGLNIASINTQGGTGGAGGAGDGVGNGGAGGNANAGAVSITSESSLVLETGNTGVNINAGTAGVGGAAGGGLGSVAGAGGSTTAGTATFTANNATSGSISLPATGNNFAGGNLGTVKLITAGNATATDSNFQTILADGTNVAGILTFNNISTAGGTNIRDNGTTGNITAGTANLTVPTNSATSYVNFTGGNNSIANIQIKAGGGATTFNDNTSFSVLSGTAVSGTAALASGGSITITGTGPVTFLAALSLNSASGAITISDASALFNAKVTAVAAGAGGTVSFAGLSLATNFNGITPSVTTSNNSLYYTAPSP